MPYILDEQRPDKKKLLDKVFELCESKGDINFCCTYLVHLWAIRQMKRIKSLVKKYDILNDAYGILCSAASEFYNAVVFPYEKLKRQENGPVSQLDASPDGNSEPKYICEDCGHKFHSPDEVVGSGDYYLMCPACKSENYRENV